jgi:DNA ligase D-like protein (predicted 3'-phosphoesterase)
MMDAGPPAKHAEGRAMALEPYKAKRNFKRTSEPTGGKPARPGRERFVIQKHDATALHYDFRIEAGGVLKSWAVPKGPSLDPREKRLAMPTEDHPLDYGDFEGVIPEGEYGAGPVIVWDTGTYRNDTKRKGRPVDVEEGIESGHVRIWLEGHKLRGGWALTRVSKGDRPRWLLVKMKDETADARRNPVSTQPESVLTGRTIKDMVGE